MDMKEALDKAAASTDQAVRSMALRYREMQAELTQYEAFFNIYKMGIKVNGSPAVAARPAPAPRERTSAPRAQHATRGDKVDVFGTRMRDILLTVGHPMKLAEVFATYQTQHPEDQTSIETFRQRLVKRRGIIVLVKGQGYWWAETPLATEDTSENA